MLLFPCKFACRKQGSQENGEKSNENTSERKDDEFSACFAFRIVRLVKMNSNNAMCATKQSTHTHTRHNGENTKKEKGKWKYTIFSKPNMRISVIEKNRPIRRIPSSLKCAISVEHKTREKWKSKYSMYRFQWCVSHLRFSICSVYAFFFSLWYVRLAWCVLCVCVCIFSWLLSIFYSSFFFGCVSFAFIRLFVRLPINGYMVHIYQPKGVITIIL